MDTIAEFLAMGGYARFVWPAYLIAATVLSVLVGVSLRDLHRQESMLRDLRRERRGATSEEEWT